MDLLAKTIITPPKTILNSEYLPLNLKPKLYAAGRESKIELLMLVSDFEVNSTLEILKAISVESMECLNEDT